MHLPQTNSLPRIHHSTDGFSGKKNILHYISQNINDVLFEKLAQGKH